MENTVENNCPQDVEKEELNKQTQSETQKLFSPIWLDELSIVLTPIFGSYVICQNWKALGKTEEANHAEKWVRNSIIFQLILWCTIVFNEFFLIGKYNNWWELFSTPMAIFVSVLTFLGYIVFFEIWHYKCCKKQTVYFADNYFKPKKSFSKKSLLPIIGIAVGILFVWNLGFAILFTIFDYSTGVWNSSESIDSNFKNGFVVVNNNYFNLRHYKSIKISAQIASKKMDYDLDPDEIKSRTDYLLLAAKLHTDLQANDFYYKVDSISEIQKTWKAAKEKKQLSIPAYGFIIIKLDSEKIFLTLEDKIPLSEALENIEDTIKTLEETLFDCF